MSRPRGFVSKTVVLARKDLMIESRARDTLPPMVAFSLAVTLLLAFTLPDASRLAPAIRLPAGTAALADVLAGFVWVIVLFAGLIGFARTFEIERDLGALDSLLLVPVDRSGLFLAKASANLAFVLIVEAFVLPLFSIAFGIDIDGRWLLLVLLVVLVDIGFVAVGTLFASLAAQTTSRELMLPILALPALVPIFIAAVELTSEIFSGGGFDAVASGGWLAVLIVFDVVFGIVGALGFDLALD